MTECPKTGDGMPRLVNFSDAMPVASQLRIDCDSLWSFGSVVSSFDNVIPIPRTSSLGMLSSSNMSKDNWLMTCQFFAAVPPGTSQLFERL